MLTRGRAREDYVKAIYQLGAGQPIAGADLARYLGVSRAAVTKFRRVLAANKLVERSNGRTDHIRLSPRGRALAVGMLRRHRLIETLLHRLGVPLHALHAQAEAIEHVISADVARRLERYLGRPQVDPHGHQIAGLARAGRGRTRVLLSDAPKGSRVRIEGIPDRDPSVVRNLMAGRVLPGLVATVVDEAGRGVVLRSNGGTHRVSARAAAAIPVSVVTRRGAR